MFTKLKLIEKETTTTTKTEKEMIPKKTKTNTLEKLHLLFLYFIIKLLYYIYLLTDNYNISNILYYFYRPNKIFSTNIVIFLYLYFHIFYFE